MKPLAIALTAAWGTAMWTAIALRDKPLAAASVWPVAIGLGVASYYWAVERG